jgi:pimeloyl-ACP methyl ester carboxylesterase
MTGDTGSPSFDEMVERVLLRVTTPRRAREPQLAAPLVDVDRVMVPTPAGAVAAWRLGDGPATMLIHGWQDDSSLWSPLMEALQQASMPFVAFDLPAHGFSEGDRGLPFELVDAAHAVVDALGPVDALVAHSFAGGGSALTISEGLPAERLVLIAPPLWPSNATRFHRVAAQYGYPTEVADRARDIYRATTAASRADYDMRTRVTELDAAVLIVSSLDDERMAVEDARTIAPMLRNGELFELRGPDHRGCAQDPVVIQRVVEFLGADQISS